MSQSSFSSSHLIELSDLSCQRSLILHVCMQAQQTAAVGAAAFGTWLELKGALMRWCSSTGFADEKAETYLELCPQVSLKGASCLQLLLQLCILGLHTGRQFDLAHQEAANIQGRMQAWHIWIC